jgi:hypothetical protein
LWRKAELSLCGINSVQIRDKELCYQTRPPPCNNAGGRGKYEIEPRKDNTTAWQV